MVSSVNRQGPGSVPVLPFDVRYALRYRGAEMGAEEVLSLQPTFAPMCVYGVSRLLQAEGKLDTLPPVLREHLWGSDDSFANEAAKALDGVSGTVAMPKLAEHSRKLFATEAAYRGAAQQHAGEMVYLLAHSPLVGVKPFAASHQNQFGILFEPTPHELSWTSIIIDPTEMVVSGLRNAREGPTNGVVLDDIERTGATHAHVLAAFPGATFDSVG